MGTLAGDEPDLQLGASGEHVAQLQDRLRALHLLTKRPDGSFDSETEAAVHRFQSDRGLTVDGVVGHRTWVALDDHMLDLGLHYNAAAGPGYQSWDVAAAESEHLVAHEAAHVQQQAPAHQPAEQQQVEPHWDGQQWLRYDAASGQWVPMVEDAAAPAAPAAEPPVVPHIDNVHPAVREDERFSSFHDFLRETHG